MINTNHTYRRTDEQIAERIEKRGRATKARRAERRELSNVRRQYVNR